MQSRWMVTGSQHNVPTLIEKMCYLFTKENWMEMLILNVSYARSADQVCEEEDDDDDDKK